MARGPAFRLPEYLLARGPTFSLAENFQELIVREEEEAGEEKAFLLQVVVETFHNLIQQSVGLLKVYLVKVDCILHKTASLYNMCNFYVISKLV